jgi:DNA-binding CsgD family transcriptional regulator
MSEDLVVVDVNSHAEVLLDAVRQADRRGLLPMNPDTNVLLEVARGGLVCSVVRSRRAGLATARRLSPRELEVAEMVADGYANKTIASALDISPWTVATHLRRLFAKFNVTTRAEMVARLRDRSRDARD